MMMMMMMMMISTTVITSAVDSVLHTLDLNLILNLKRALSSIMQRQ